MAYRFSLAEVDYLVSAAGQQALAQAASLPLAGATLLSDLRRVRQVAGDCGGAVAETIRLRRQVADRLGPQAAHWLLTDEAAQQASPAAVAAHRAARLAEVGVHDATCSIGADTAALARTGPVVGSDIDPVRLAMARHNCPGVEFREADATRYAPPGLLGYADPARRAEGRRLTGLDVIPSVAALDELRANRLPVLRMPPGLDYVALGRPGEVEAVSLDGTMRELVLWPPECAGVARRASVLGAGGFAVTSDDPATDHIGRVDNYLVEPDAAVIRAHLVQHFAARHGLHRIDAHLAYLSGPVAPPGFRSFAVLDSAPFGDRVLTEWIRRDQIGTLEIKQRGTSVIPDQLRLRLRPVLRTFDRRQAATVVIARIGSAARALWCRAVDLR